MSWPSPYHRSRNQLSASSTRIVNWPLRIGHCLAEEDGLDLDSLFTAIQWPIRNGQLTICLVEIQLIERQNVDSIGRIFLTYRIPRRGVDRSSTGNIGACDCRPKRSVCP